jgi:hypothetical protein
MGIIRDTVELVTGSPVPLDVRYQWPKKVKLQPLESPWIDPRTSDTIYSNLYLRESVPIISWVEHWSKSFPPQYLLGLVTLFSAPFALRTQIDFDPRLLAVTPLICFLSILSRYPRREINRWSNVYTLADDGNVHRIFRSWGNLAADSQEIPSKSVIDTERDWNILYRAVGCLRKLSGETIGGGVGVELEYVPWPYIIDPLIDFLRKEKNTSTHALLGLHWLNGTERRNLEKNLEILRESTEVGSDLDSIYYFTRGLWKAFRAYEDFIKRNIYQLETHKERMERQAEIYTRNHLQRLMETDRNYESALYSWSQGLNPSSKRWQEFLPLLTNIMGSWGSITTPHFYQEKVKND